MEDMIVLGPSISNISKINNIYYFQIIIKYRDKDKINELLKDIMTFEKDNKNINLNIDINPINL